MELPINTFKRALREQRHQTGLWVTLGHPNSTELVAASGFDWLLLDTEHTPALLPTVMAQLQAAAAYGSHPVVRPSWNDKVQIKQYLDIGAQTLLLPYVQNAHEAESAVAGMRYAPRGVRGVSGPVDDRRHAVIAVVQQRHDAVGEIAETISAAHRPLRIAQDGEIEAMAGRERAVGFGRAVDDREHGEAMAGEGGHFVAISVELGAVAVGGAAGGEYQRHRAAREANLPRACQPLVVIAKLKWRRVVARLEAERRRLAAQHRRRRRRPRDRENLGASLFGGGHGREVSVTRQAGGDAPGESVAERSQRRKGARRAIAAVARRRLRCRWPAPMAKGRTCAA